MALLWPVGWEAEKGLDRSGKRREQEVATSERPPLRAEVTSAGLCSTRSRARAPPAPPPLSVCADPWVTPGAAQCDPWVTPRVTPRVAVSVS